MHAATMQHMVNAAKAVKNHPEITVITPVMRYTALSRPQALSAREEPIATMNVTYVVERGSRRDVAREISRAATVKFTEARIRSKEAPLSGPSGTGWKRFSMNLPTQAGMIFSTAREAFNA